MVASDSDSEPPLDPAAERLRARLVRLLLASGLIMVLGFIAVFAAIVYKLGLWGLGGAPAPDGGPVQGQAGPAKTPVVAEIALPAGARLVSTTLDDGRALLQLQGADGNAMLLLVDLDDGRVLGTYSFGGK